MNKKHGSNVPLVLMNSFNTHSDTERIRFKYERRVDLHMFQQSYYPRVLKETLRPYPEKVDLQDGRYRGKEGESLLICLVNVVSGSCACMWGNRLHRKIAFASGS